MIFIKQWILLPALLKWNSRNAFSPVIRWSLRSSPNPLREDLVEKKKKQARLPRFFEKRTLQKATNQFYTPQRLTARTWKWWFGRWVSFSRVDSQVNHVNLLGCKQKKHTHIPPPQGFPTEPSRTPPHIHPFGNRLSSPPRRKMTLSAKALKPQFTEGEGITHWFLTRCMQ